MKPFQLISLFLLTALRCAWGEVPSGWSTNLTHALAESKTNQQPVLAFFTASWCPPCRMMVRTTLTNEEVKLALARVLPVAIDIDEQAELARASGITAVPTFQLLLPSGDVVAATSGYQPAGPFVEWVTNGVNTAREAEARRERFRETLAEINGLMAGSATNDWGMAASRLLEACDASEAEIAKIAVGKLADLARQHPETLLDGLNHPRLGVRIQAANLLRAVVGEAFDFDPWSDAATRRDAVAKWRQKLANPAVPDAAN